ncbi:hypothetical protein KA005_05895 [bacterium]|nr:hypothetical protein [bacterium]
MRLNKYKKIRPYTYIKEEYYQRFEYPMSLENFVRLFEKRNEALQSNVEIQLKNIPFSVSHKEIIAKLGKPNLIKKAKFMECNHTILFYQKIIADHKVIIQIHLLEDIFFYGLVTCINMQTIEIDIINKTLLTKYLNGRENINCASITIYDKKDNKINLNVGVYITLQYTTGNREILRTLNQLIKDKQLMEKNEQDYIVKQFCDGL